MNLKNKNFCKISITGLNLENYLNKLKDENIEIYNLNRPEYNQIEFVTPNRNLKYINSTCGVLKLDIIKHIGYKSFKDFIIKNLGYIIGCILALILLIISSKYTFHIKIIGLENVPEDCILQSINDFGVKTFQINVFDSDKLAEYILDNNTDISLVSIEKIGTALVLNIKEKSSKLPESVEPYLAPDNLLIKDFEVSSGISNLKIDKIVKKGEVLIYPEEYLDKEGKLQLIKPKGYINATIWHTATETILKEETIYERTGNKITNYNFNIGKIKLFKKYNEHNYKYYEEVSRIKDISISLIPIKYYETIYYETTPVIIQNDFNSIKDEIIAKLETVVYNKVSQGEEVLNKIVDVK